MVGNENTRLQISCSAPKLRRLAQQSRPKVINPATPVATPRRVGRGPSSSAGGGRKGSRQCGPDSLHSRLIDRYLETAPGAARRGFPAALRAVLDEDPMDWMSKLEDWADIFQFSPDAFRVQPGEPLERSLTVVEVEVTSRISAQKWDCLAQLWWLLDYGEWSLLVHTVDRNGTVFSIDMPRVGLCERLASKNPRPFFRDLERQPPGRVVGELGRPLLEDDWPDAVQEYFSAHGGFVLGGGS